MIAAIGAGSQLTNGTSMTVESRLVIVSNRLPSLRLPTNEAECRTAPVGGLVTALQAALEMTDGLWFGWSGETEEGDSKSAPKLSKVGQIQLASMDLSEEDVDLFYNEFCNRTLWPLLHSFPSKTNIRRDAFSAYLETNRKYAEALFCVLKEGDLIWVHDYHLIPLGHELRRLGWERKIGHFIHTPFPPSEIFTVLPWASQLLNMFLGYDLVGLHTRRYVNNFHDSLCYELPGDIIGDMFTDGSRFLKVSTCPIGINPKAFQHVTGQFAYYVCGTLFREGAGTCSARYLNAPRVEDFIVEKIRERILTEETIVELVTLVAEEIDAMAGELSGRLEVIEAELGDVRKRLERLYEAIETSKLTLEVLSPRIMSLRHREEQLEAARDDAATQLEQRRVELPTTEEIKGYVADFRDFLQEGTIPECKALIRNFVEGIEVVGDEATLTYTVPMPNDGVTSESASVLDFVKSGPPNLTVDSTIFELCVVL